MNNIYKHPLIRYLENSGKAPAERLTYLFELMAKIPATTLSTGEQKELLQYLTTLAKSSNIRHPEAFAQQIFFMAAGAEQKQLSLPESHALKHAQTAARALIAAQSRNRFSRNSHLYAMAASFFLFFGISSMMLSSVPAPIPSEELQIGSPVESGNTAAFENIYNPKRISEILSSREKMRQGTCVFPEALMLAEADRGIYLKTVVYGEISQDIKEQEVTTRLMQSVRCDYTPMLMKSSIS